MNFNAPYNRPDALAFLDRFLPDDFTAAAERVKLEFVHDHITEVFKIGHTPALDLPVYEIHHTSENDPRVSLSKGAFRLLAAHGQTRALILFTSAQSPNYRLSLVTIDLQLTGKKVVKEYSNPRRYSFFLGPDAKTHTPCEYLEKKGPVKDFDDLQKRFSIEVVNKDFYNQIAALFTQLTGGVRGKGKKALDAGSGCLIYPGQDDQKRKEFAVRLIGRLVFCWFLKKKGSVSGPLIPESLLSVAALSQKDYYHAILEPLFFQVLNTPGEERDKHFQAAPWSAIPFLNGGLFSPQHDDYYEPGSLGLSKNIGLIKVPDAWLKELFNVFETYNFTIDENTSVDVELSIDPEMLGRIFENLLAEINPETGETARKATGSYYTPRPIVEYMVDESLKQYLLTKTGLPEEKIAPLLSYSDENLVLNDSEKESIITALHQVKVIDPACGSGAFPMGILQKILLVLQKLDPDSTIWLDKMLTTIPDPIYRKELKKKKIPNYLHKLGIIRDCIYGVDIQPIAVEISKLRCFLSLIVDEKVRDEEPNRGIEPLPNLEFKFVCANTLIGLPKLELQEGKKKGKKVVESKGQTSFLEDTESIDELRRLREEYLNCTGREKEKLEKQFRKVQSKMFHESLFWQGADSQTEKLSQWDPFSHEPSSWFDPDWMFGIKDGFDIVIANPPYVDSEIMTVKNPQERELLRSLFKTAQGNWDLFIVFVEEGIELLADNGIFVYIIPNKLIGAKYAKPLKEYLATNSVIEIRDYSRLNVFLEANIYPITIVVKKCQSEINGFVNMITMKDIVTCKTINRIPCCDFNADVYWDRYFLDDTLVNMLLKIWHNPKLGDCCKGIFGAATVNEAYKFKEIIIDSNASSGKRLVNTGTIDRYVCLWGIKKTQYIKDSYIHPVLLDKDIKKINENRFIQANSSKLIIAGMSSGIEAIYDDGEIIAGKSTTIIIDEPMRLFLLLGILNSKLINYFVNNFYHSLKMAGGYININKEILSNIPIAKADITIAKIAQEIVAMKNNDMNSITKKLELKIDQLVYQLYSLTAEEIALVEGKSS